MKLDVFDYVGMFAGLLMVLALVILFLRFVKSIILSIARSKSMEKGGRATASASWIRPSSMICRKVQICMSYRFRWVEPICVDGAGAASVAYESLECIALRLRALLGGGAHPLCRPREGRPSQGHAGILEDYVSSEGVPYA